MTAVPPPIRRRIASLTVAAVAGVAVIVLLWQLRAVVGDAAVPAGRLVQLLQLSLFSIVVGSFLAVPICLMIGLPLWDFAIRSDRQRLRDAMRFGLFAGGFVGAVMAIIGDPGTRWFDEPLDFLGYCLAGVFAGAVTYRLGYPRS